MLKRESLFFSLSFLFAIWLSSQSLILTVQGQYYPNGGYYYGGSGLNLSSLFPYPSYNDSNNYTLPINRTGYNITYNPDEYRPIHHRTHKHHHHHRQPDYVPDDSYYNRQSQPKPDYSDRPAEYQNRNNRHHHKHNHTQIRNHSHTNKHKSKYDYHDKYDVGYEKKSHNKDHQQKNKKKHHKNRDKYDDNDDDDDDDMEYDSDRDYKYHNNKKSNKADKYKKDKKYNRERYSSPAGENKYDETRIRPIKLNEKLRKQLERKYGKYDPLYGLDDDVYPEGYKKHKKSKKNKKESKKHRKPSSEYLDDKGAAGKQGYAVGDRP